ncbi:hypothetical protein PEPS_45400 (plasmid) [Persicobacter psychrovividus]|uniref:Uncharacterized protein n=1 Tax=Persicobacter psychrovividus TaxID=387638 RepID=A0ABM7VML7_9BACT|nr:hypothetical protein PEPS_45400 [Persicobacter psychrovividus]
MGIWEVIFKLETVFHFFLEVEALIFLQLK